MGGNNENKGRPRRTVSPYLVIRRSRIHGTGAFARTDIPEGTRVIEYVGDRVTKAESDRRYQIAWERSQNGNGDEGIVYIFTLNKRHDIDGEVWWNTAKYINHSCDPNCETDIIRGHVWIIATRDIKKGEEISYNYGYDLDAWEDHPCHCGSEKCVGFIVDEEHWRNLRRRKRYRELLDGKNGGSSRRERR
jgi:SET domain-containing protein